MGVAPGAGNIGTVVWHAPAGPCFAARSGARWTMSPERHSMPTPRVDLLAPTPRNKWSTTDTSFAGSIGAGSAFANPNGKFVVRKIKDLLGNPEALKDAVRQCFEKAAFGRQSLDLYAFGSFLAAFLKDTDLPDHAFENITDDFVRFDFNGDNSLQQHECYRLVKYHARKYLHSNGHVISEIMVPYKTFEEEGITFVRELGQGSQGRLMLVMKRGEIRNQKSVTRCIKVLKKHQTDMVSLDDLKDEYKILHGLRNTRIAKIFDIFQDSEHYFLVNEPYFGGDFSTLREKARSRSVAMSEDWWRNIFRQCLEGLAYMHKHALMHCDIKEPNIMLKSENIFRPDVVIVDFGIVQEFVHPKIRLSGTPGYIPPETWAEKKWFPKGDMFSLGVCMAQLVLDKSPVLNPITQRCMSGGLFIEGASSLEDVKAFTSRREPPFHALEENHTSMTKFLRQVLQKDMMARYSAPTALLDGWFTAAPKLHSFGARTMDTWTVETTEEPGRATSPFNSRFDVTSPRPFAPPARNAPEVLKSFGGGFSAWCDSGPIAMTPRPLALQA